MSFDDTEASVDGASPRYLFYFTRGARGWAYTGADETVQYNGITFAKETISRSEIEHSLEDDAGGLKISLPAKNELAQQFIGIAPTAPTYVTVFCVHRNGAAQVQFSGRVSEPSFKGTECTLTCLPLAGALNRSIPTLLYQKQCNWALYGPGCGILKTLFRISATIDVVDGLRLQSADFATKPDGWFTHGFVELRVGDRVGDRRPVLEHVGDLLVLNAPFVALMAGEPVYAFAGCDLAESTCRDKFDNVINHLGFARIPTRNPYRGRMA